MERNRKKTIGGWVSYKNYEIIMKYDKNNIEEVLATFPVKEELVIRLRFLKVTLEEIARLLHLSRERVRQIEAKAIRRLKHPYRLPMLEKGRLQNEK